MATVTITLTDKEDTVLGKRVGATLVSTPGIEFGEGAEPLTPAQALALEMMEVQKARRLVAAKGEVVYGEITQAFNTTFAKTPE